MERLIIMLTFSVLIAPAGFFGLAMAAETAVSTAPAQVTLPASTPPPVNAGLPKVEIKIEKLELAAAVKEIAQSDAASALDLYRTIGDLYIRAQKPEKAISLLETYRGQGGDNQGILLHLASLYMQKNALGQAAEVYESVLKLSPANPQTISMLLILYNQQGDLVKKAALLETNSKAAPNNTEILGELVDIYLAQNERVKAAAVLKKAMGIAPKAEHYLKLAELKGRDGGIDEAVAALQEGIKKFPAREADFVPRISEYYLRAGQPDKALAVLEAAVKNLPESLVPLTFAISDILAMNKGEKDKAVAMLKDLMGKVSDPAQKNLVDERLKFLIGIPVPAGTP